MHWIIKVEMWETFFYNLMKLLKFNHSEQVSLSGEKDMVCIFEEEDYYDDEVLLSLVDMSVTITLLTIINNEILCVLMDH